MFLTDGITYVQGEHVHFACSLVGLSSSPLQAGPPVAADEPLEMDVVASRRHRMIGGAQRTHFWARMNLFMDSAGLLFGPTKERESLIGFRCLFEEVETSLTMSAARTSQLTRQPRDSAHRTGHVEKWEASAASINYCELRTELRMTPLDFVVKGRAIPQEFATSLL